MTKAYGQGWRDGWNEAIKAAETMLRERGQLVSAEFVSRLRTAATTISDAAWNGELILGGVIDDMTEMIKPYKIEEEKMTKPLIIVDVQNDFISDRSRPSLRRSG
jgi:hypothetical protein